MHSELDVHGILVERVSRAQSRYAACAARAGVNMVDFAGVLALARQEAVSVTPAPQTPAAAGSAPSVAGQTAYDGLIREAAARYGLDPALIRAVIQIESRFQSDAVSYAGAMGLMQLMPGTAAWLGVTDPMDPAQNIDGGARYLRQQLDRFGDVRLALAAYTAGPGSVSSLNITDPDDPAQYGRLSDRVRNYVNVAMDYYRQYADGSTGEGYRA